MGAMFKQGAYELILLKPQSVATKIMPFYGSRLEIPTAIQYIVFFEKFPTLVRLLLSKRKPYFRGYIIGDIYGT